MFSLAIRAFTGSLSRIFCDLDYPAKQSIASYITNDCSR